MNEQDTQEGKGKWFKLIAILFASLFAVFWSLGSFFFWFLLGGTVYFTFLSVYSSGTQFNFFQKSQNDQDPYRSYRGTARPSSQVNPAVRIVRIVLFSVVGFFFFLVFIGIFFGEDTTAEDNTPPSNETTETSSTIEIDDNSKGNDFFRDGNYDSALWYYERVLAKNPDDRDGLYNKSLVYSMKQEYSRSIPIARRCLSLYPDNNDALWLLGYDYNAINNLDSAVYSVEKAYSNDFREVAFLQLMGEIYVKTGAHDKAKEFYLKVIESDSDNIDSYKALVQLDPDNAARYEERINALEQGK